MTVTMATMNARVRDASRVATAARVVLGVLVAFVLTVGCVPDPVGRTTRAPATPTPPSPTAPTTGPEPTGPTPVPTFRRPTPTPLPTFYVHVVTAGDSLTSIARRYGTSPFSLSVWNREVYPSLDPESPDYAPDRIRAGWLLRLIPGKEVDPEDLLSATPSPAG